MTVTARDVATGFGLGRVPVAPGTAASAAAAAFAALLPRPLLPAAALLATAGGFLAARRLADIDDDPAPVVIDEIAGQLLALLGPRRRTGRGLLAAFLLFRLLDIGKPGPVGALDRRRGALGVMGDDVAAGLLAALALRLVPARSLR